MLNDWCNMSRNKYRCEILAYQKVSYGQVEQHRVDAWSRSSSPLQQKEEYCKIACGGDHKEHAVGDDREQVAVVESHVQRQFCRISHWVKGRVFGEKLARVVIVEGQRYCNTQKGKIYRDWKIDLAFCGGYQSK